MVRKYFFDCISRFKGKVASQDRLSKETADKLTDYFSSVCKILASNFESKKENVSKSSRCTINATNQGHFAGNTGNNK